MGQGLRALHTSALHLFNAARASQEYEVAYHALAAVLHAAERLEDGESCREVERLANECRETIDANHPGHRLSSRTAQSRGHDSIYRQLAVTAVSARLRIESVAKKQKGARGRPSAG